MIISVEICMVLLVMAVMHVDLCILQSGGHRLSTYRDQMNLD